MARPHEMLVNLDMAQLAILSAVLDPRDDDPSSPVNGQVWYRSNLNQFRVYADDGIESIAFVSNIPVGTVSENLWDANTIVKADADNTPVVLEISPSTLVGRAATGGISDLSIAQVKTLLSIPSGALATTTDVSDAINALVDGASLNTLNKLSAALGDDPNYAATITASLATKAGAFTTLIGDGSTTEYTIVHGFDETKTVGALYTNDVDEERVYARERNTSGGYVIEFETAPAVDAYRFTAIGVA